MNFLLRLVPFLKTIPAGYRFVVEIRNKNWLVPALIDTLREHHVGLALLDHVWMPRPKQLFERGDPDHDGFCLRALARRPQGHRGQRRKRGTKLSRTSRRTWADWVEVLKESSTNGKFRFLRLPTITLPGSGRERLRSFERCGGAPTVDR